MIRKVLSHIINLVIDNNPTIILFIMLNNLLWCNTTKLFLSQLFRYLEKLCLSLPISCNNLFPLCWFDGIIILGYSKLRWWRSILLFNEIALNYRVNWYMGCLFRIIKSRLIKLLEWVIHLSYSDKWHFYFLSLFCKIFVNLFPY